MKVDNALIKNLALLSKLEFNKTDLNKITADLQQIFEFVQKLKKIDTNHVKPLIYISEEQNILRDDEVKKVVAKKDALKNAPSKDSDYFKVPTVLKK
ncbi:MAG: Asp-tRNA(Asn)/Glu-tRNA(Gln) amidotransferase subunit GatC [Bacteroidota bacterium]|nr:Asp-tRNA(Asn)/Glu-tRNA(Gln) amidotransferase subunit GatC [Bacteroidota bacterium]